MTADEPMSTKDRRLLTWIAERTDAESMPDPACATSDATFADSWNVFIHWRTARRLVSDGLLRMVNVGTGEGDPTTYELTDAGWKATR